MADRQPLIAGNWKMNGTRASASAIRTLLEDLEPSVSNRIDVVVCPPSTLIREFYALTTGSAVAIGGQDCHPAAFGAHTGDISAEMLKDAGASWVILGHSERRQNHGETDALVREKVDAALRSRLMAMICVGESLEQRESGEASSVVKEQLIGSLPAKALAQNIVVAYEPIWAIGTGKSATPDDIAKMHAMIRQTLRETQGAEGEGIRILYGGSVKPSNAKEILAIDDVDGALVGGASLKADEFIEIIKAVP